MDAALILALPVIGGYFFASIFRVTKYAAAREDGHRLYFRAVLFAAFLFIGALLVQYVLGHVEWYTEAENTLAKHIQPLFKKEDNVALSKLGVTSVWALFLGITLAYGLNPFVPRIWALKRAVRTNDLENMLFRAALRKTLICVDLDNRKTYVGRVLTVDPDNHERRALSMVPLLSGFRTQDSLRLEFSTDYGRLLSTLGDPGRSLPPPLDHLTVEDFIVVFPVARIVACHGFDLQVYEKFAFSEPPLPVETKVVNTQASERVSVPLEPVQDYDLPASPHGATPEPPR